MSIQSESPFLLEICSCWKIATPAPQLCKSTIQLVAAVVLLLLLKRVMVMMMMIMMMVMMMFL